MNSILSGNSQNVLRNNLSAVTHYQNHSTNRNLSQLQLNQTIAEIKERLSHGKFDWTVSHDDVKFISNTLANLDSADAQKVFEELDKSGYGV